MGKVDLEIRDTIWTFIIPFAALVAVVLIFLTDSSKGVRSRFVKWFLKDFGIIRDELTTEIRRALFADLSDIESKVIDLRNKGLIRILEIGIGSGSNLKYYPQQCRLVVVDPNVYFKQYFEENKTKFQDIHLEKYIISSGENMRAVAPKSVDVVVTTAVLCSVESVSTVLQEIRRVLVPGGRYYFLEHVLDIQNSQRFKLQQFLTSSKLWPWLFDGCKFQNICSQIAEAGFSNFDFKEFTLEPEGIQGKSKWAIRLMAPHVVGVAMK